MNKRQVIILWGIAAALGVAVATVKLSQNEAAHSTTKRGSGQTLFDSFPGNDVATIEILGTGGTVTLVKKEGKWVVVQRDNYPANPAYANDLIRTLAELKVTRGMEAGPSFAPRFGMDEAASKPADRGLTAVFKDASGKEVAKVGLGKNIGAEESPAPMMGMGGGAVGRYVRNFADESGFYAVSEMFPSVNDEPKRWLSADFISPEKVKSITVSQTDKSDTAWEITRDGEEAEFKLDGAAATEVLDTAVTGPLKTVLSYARFEDVVPADKVAARAATGKCTVTIETFEGFTYTLSLTPTKPDSAPPAPAAPGMEPPATDNFLLTVDVAAEIPKERKKEENEKPEDAKAKDEAFASRSKALTEKLAKEKAFSGITFEVAKSTVESLVKDRDALIAKAKPATQDAPSAGNIQQMPGGLIATPPVSATTPPIEAVTPPISVPAADDEDAMDEDDSGDEEEE